MSIKTYIAKTQSLSQNGTRFDVYNTRYFPSFATPVELDNLTLIGDDLFSPESIFTSLPQQLNDTFPAFLIDTPISRDDTGGLASLNPQIIFANKPAALLNKDDIPTEFSMVTSYPSVYWAYYPGFGMLIDTTPIELGWLIVGGRYLRSNPSPFPTHTTITTPQFWGAIYGGCTYEPDMYGIWHHVTLPFPGTPPAIYGYFDTGTLYNPPQISVPGIKITGADQAFIIRSCLCDPETPYDEYGISPWGGLIHINSANTSLTWQAMSGGTIALVSLSIFSGVRKVPGIATTVALILLLGSALCMGGGTARRPKVQ